ncbi:hypothetical protein P167DRAFT_127244 [Morchella conica CCBAS932]|uniref:Uncharacterized protein n=1 Tax=Morchella conica CCBAS932 TaxID=1392247 RepID=A0A3N4LHC7_9PEZI|nr:hypothetical protein P167DRAFT_127244 [Morchella conica CCBAS932]
MNRCYQTSLNWTIVLKSHSTMKSSDDREEVNKVINPVLTRTQCPRYGPAYEGDRPLNVLVLRLFELLGASPFCATAIGSSRSKIMGQRNRELLRGLVPGFLTWSYTYRYPAIRAWILPIDRFGYAGQWARCRRATYTNQVNIKSFFQLVNSGYT